MFGMVNRPSGANSFARMLGQGVRQQAKQAGPLAATLQSAAGGLANAHSPSPVPESGTGVQLPEGVVPAQALADMPITFVNMPPIQGAATLREVFETT